MKYLAFDGKVFENEADCRAYEREHDISFACQAIGNATANDIENALAYRNKDLAALIEKVAYRIGQARRAAGDVKRRVNKGETSTAEPDETVAEVAPPEPPAPPATDDPFAAAAAA
jgi:hypothetical protein